MTPLCAKSRASIKAVFCPYVEHRREPTIATNALIALQNAQAAERLAEANLSAAEKELARGKVLHEQGALPDSGWDKVQTGHELAAESGFRGTAKR